MDSKDLLALERSQLANERTFLAYFRTFIVLISSGIAILKLDALKDILFLGYALILIAPFLLFIGIYRFKNTRIRLTRILYPSNSPKEKTEVSGD